MMNEHGKSDSCVISAKLPNKDLKTTQNYLSGIDDDDEMSLSNELTNFVR